MKKLLDIPDTEVERLKIEAVRANVSFKKYLESKFILGAQFVTPKEQPKEKIRICDNHDCKGMFNCPRCKDVEPKDTKSEVMEEAIKEQNAYNKKLNSAIDSRKKPKQPTKKETRKYVKKNFGDVIKKHAQDSKEYGYPKSRSLNKKS
jgi:hypothetical protein